MRGCAANKSSISDVNFQEHKLVVLLETSEHSHPRWHFRCRHRAKVLQVSLEVNWSNFEQSGQC